MIIGILADTHDNVQTIQKAISFFNGQEVQYVIHAGDYVAPFSLKELTKIKAKFIGVFGNNDGDRARLLSMCKNIHVPPYDILLNGKHLVVTHTLDSLSKRTMENMDVVISAHTHVPEIKQGRPMYLNPGECCGWVNGRSTVALLNLETLHAEIIDLFKI